MTRSPAERPPLQNPEPLWGSYKIDNSRLSQVSVETGPYFLPFSAVVSKSEASALKHLEVQQRDSVLKPKKILADMPTDWTSTRLPREKQLGLWCDNRGPKRHHHNQSSPHFEGLCLSLSWSECSGPERRCFRRFVSGTQKLRSTSPTRVSLG